MKFLKSKKAIAEGADTFRKIVNDDKTKVLAVVGTVGDLLKLGVLDSCNLPETRWCCIPADVNIHGEMVGFGFSRDDAIDRANYGFGIG